MDMSEPPIITGDEDAAKPEGYESDTPAKGCSILLHRGVKFHGVVQEISLTNEIHAIMLKFVPIRKVRWCDGESVLSATALWFACRSQVVNWTRRGCAQLSREKGNKQFACSTCFLIAPWQGTVRHGKYAITFRIVVQELVKAEPHYSAISGGLSLPMVHE